MSARFTFHPILENKKSRSIFLIFLFISFFIGLGFSWYVDVLLKRLGLSTHAEILVSNHFRFMVSVYFRSAVIMVSALLGAGFIAGRITGPVHRIEQWLQDWIDGLNPFPLLVRKNDKFLNLVKLLNALYQKTTHPDQPFS